MTQQGCVKFSISKFIKGVTRCSWKVLGSGERKRSGSGTAATSSLLRTFWSRFEASRPMGSHASIVSQEAALKGRAEKMPVGAKHYIFKDNFTEPPFPDG